jgi:UDP-N-acetylmuramate--alanine ligase
LEAALEHQVPIIRRGELVGSLFNARLGIAVAGSHGKSTTTGMLVWTLRALNQHPSYAIGASLPTTTSTVALDTGSTMVVEADEFDHQFLWLHSQVTIVTNVEFDHPDVFPSQEAYDDDFRRFVQNTKPSGTILLANDDPGSSRVRDALTLPDAVSLQTFGEADGADWLVGGEEGAWTVRTPTGEQITLRLAVPGRHNARNATAALAALTALGWEPREIAEVLETFPGVGRRFEILGTAHNIVVVDDYAHHPTEVRATIRAARGKYPDRRLFTVFQPHTFSRTLALLDEFALALGESDRVALLDIYAATETDDLGVSSQTLARLLSTPATTVGDPDSAVEHLARMAEPGDVLLTLGAGTITSVGPRLLHRLSEHGPNNRTNSTTVNQAVE